MELLDAMLDVVADLIVDAELAGHDGPLRNFDDFVIALSADSGLSVAEVQSKLVTRMLSGNVSNYLILNTTTPLS